MTRQKAARIWWIKLVCYEIVMTAIFLPFIIAGPVAIIFYWCGFDFAGLNYPEHQTGAWICTLLSLFTFPALIKVYTIPWGGDDYAWWESGSFFGEHARWSVFCKDTHG